jgi:hypothetical protein
LEQTDDGNLLGIGLGDIEISVPIGDVLDSRFWSILTNSLLSVFVYYCLGLGWELRVVNYGHLFGHKACLTEERVYSLDASNTDMK